MRNPLLYIDVVLCQGEDRDQFTTLDGVVKITFNQNDDGEYTSADAKNMLSGMGFQLIRQ